MTFLHQIFNFMVISTHFFDFHENSPSLRAPPKHFLSRISSPPLGRALRQEIVKDLENEISRASKEATIGDDRFETHLV